MRNEDKKLHENDREQDERPNALKGGERVTDEKDEQNETE